MSEAIIVWWVSPLIFVLTVLACIAVMSRSEPKNDRLIEVLDELIEAKKEIIRLKQEINGR